MSTSEETLIDLGITAEKFPKGTHICQIYSDDKEREDALLAFLQSGLNSNERVACFSDKSRDEGVSNFLTTQGFECQQLKASGQLTVSPTNPVYFKNNRFDPEVMLDALKSFDCAAHEQGQTAARVIGEMNPCICNMEGGERLFEYEAKVCILQETCSITAVCQYNLNAFDGETIMNVLKAHPLMVVSGAVVRNPFYIPAREILAQQGINV